MLWYINKIKIMINSDNINISQQQPTKGNHAIVIGGSTAGLLAGRVLTNHFERVTIVERDRRGGVICWV